MSVPVLPLGLVFWVYLSQTDARTGLVCRDALLGSTESLASLSILIASLLMLFRMWLYSFRESEGQSRVNVPCFIPGDAEVSADTFPSPFGMEKAAPLECPQTFPRAEHTPSR